ncbi:uncharacterized protein RJT20DRAFT_3741 [Scheffersomyces xylosifermentans]|uniref:uncharacterized protein n=1 Tax=Scheffersomyces xylosifermentans TaxID=1304137 RepID=UPI00315DA5CB
MIHRNSQVTVDGVDLSLVVSYGENQNTPVSVYINEANNKFSGDYVYAIKTYQTHLSAGGRLGTANIESLNLLLNKKLNRPVYLNINGDNTGDISTVSLFTEIMTLINGP